MYVEIILLPEKIVRRSDSENVIGFFYKVKTSNHSTSLCEQYTGNLWLKYLVQQ